MDTNQSNHNEYLSELNSQVFDFIKNEATSSAKIKHFIYKKLKPQLIERFKCIKSFIENLEEHSEVNNIYFIRHAESTYNSWRSKSPLINLPFYYKDTPQNRDPSITEKGQQQCNELKQRLENEFKENQIELVYVSAMTRAIQTFEMVKDSQFMSSAEVKVTHLLIERLHTAADIGNTLDEQKQKFNYDFSLIKKQKYWQHYQEEEIKEDKVVKENDKKIKERLFIILLLIVTDQKHQKVGIVSHSQLYRCFKEYDHWISLGRKIKNAEMKEMEMKKVMKYIEYILNKK